MITSDLKKLWLIFLLLLIIAVVGVVLLFLKGKPKKPMITGYEGTQPITTLSVKVIRVEPLPNQKDVSTSPTIKITFEDTIVNKKIEITTSPKIEFEEQVSPGGYNLVLTPSSQLNSSAEYTITVIAEKAEIYSWSFTTGSKGADPKVVETIKRKLPYQGDHFIISYASSTDKFFVTISAKPVGTYKQAALDWFAAQGLPNAEAAINIVYYPVGDAVR